METVTISKMSEIFPLATGQVDEKLIYFENYSYNVKEDTQKFQINLFDSKHHQKSFTNFCLTSSFSETKDSSLNEEISEKIEVSEVGKMGKKRTRTRTKGELVNELRRLAKIDKKYLNYSYCRKIKRNDLIVDAEKQYGGWRGAVIASGFRPIQRGWSKENVLQEIKRMHNTEGVILPSNKLPRKGYNGLGRAAERKFGGWGNAVKEAGFKPLRNTIKESDVLKELRIIARVLGHTPSMRQLKFLKKDYVLRAALKFFGRYNLALKAAGLPIILKMNKWNKENIVNELGDIYEKLGKKPTRSEIESLGRFDLKMATIKIFGSWNNAMIAAGFVPNTDAIYNDIGLRWENIVTQIASEIYPDSATHVKLPNRGLPDLYVFDEDLIIEAKINASENNIKKDIEKYLPYCKKMQIWYLYGKPRTFLSNKVEYVGPNQIKQFINTDIELKQSFNIINKEVVMC